MPNSLTGDFEAVLQVSGGTINRLAASMHQNAGSNTDLPRFPHTLWLRIGDDRAVDGVRGSVQAQVGVPLIGLIHGATDRFRLEVGVRARYQPDPGTTPLPAFIHGNVSAEYRIRDIDPKCLGWTNKAGNYLWVRVVRESVRFEGTALEDVNPALSVMTSALAAGAAAQAENEAKITRQIARQLATRFAARPHPVSKQFRRGGMRSLNTPEGGSAVAIPIGLSGEPAGDIGSVENLILADHDFAIGVSSGYVMSLAAPVLDTLRAYNPTISVHVHVGTPWPAPDIDVSTVYRVQLDPPSAEWQPHGSFAVIKIKVSGSAKTDSVLPNATFDIEQDIVLNFDAGAGTLWLSPGSRTVTAHVTGIGSGTIANAVQSAVHKAVKPMAEAACAQAQPSLDAMIARQEDLAAQLRTIDAQASAAVSQAVFLDDGLVLRGVISLSPRQYPVAIYEKTVENDGFTALESWIPGGRIDSLEWSWTFAGQNATGKATHNDRFLLRRPRGKPSKWGIAAVESPLPGIDENGSVCLRIRGVQVDGATGALVAVDSVRRCRRFGIDISIYTLASRGRLFLRDIPELSKPVPFPQLAVRSVEAVDPGAAANTLLLYAGRSWDPENEPALRGGLEAVKRRDAGLVLLVLFREGVLESAQSPVIERIREFGREAGVPTLVNEDVRGSWAAAYSFDPAGRNSWRLLSPGGGATWARDGRVTADELATALNHCLRTSPPARPAPLKTGATLGARVIATALYPDFLDALEEAECPPVPLGRLGIGAAVVTFVQRGSTASEAHLRTLTARYSQQEDAPALIVVVDGATPEETVRMKDALGTGFAAIADRRGEIAGRFGIRVWPTAITLDPAGAISALQIGAEGGEA